MRNFKKTLSKKLEERAEARRKRKELFSQIYEQEKRKLQLEKEKTELEMIKTKARERAKKGGVLKRLGTGLKEKIGKIELTEEKGKGLDLLGPGKGGLTLDLGKPGKPIDLFGNSKKRRRVKII